MSTPILSKCVECRIPVEPFREYCDEHDLSAIETRRAEAQEGRLEARDVARFKIVEVDVPRLLEEVKRLRTERAALLVVIQQKNLTSESKHGNLTPDSES